mgnify:CR=1 FL=1
MFKNKKVYFGIIYSYLNTINGKVYVGQTTRPNVRYKQHIQCALNNLDNTVFHKAIRKYGIQSFVILTNYIAKELIFMKGVL